MNDKKHTEIPFSRMQKISVSGVFVKRFGKLGKSAMKTYAHRDDYYLIVLLTGGSAVAEIDFERKELEKDDLLVISPWQVHNKPADDAWNADGWMLALAPEMLSEAEARLIDEYSLSTRPHRLDSSTAEEIGTLCSMMERNSDNGHIANALASAAKSIVLSDIASSGNETTGRYSAITVRLRKLLDEHLAREKSPAAYASMLNITEGYLNEAVKGATGLGAGAYIRHRVVVQAKRLLAYTSLSISEISYRLGYDDCTYFSRLFKKITGESPANYRKNLK